MPPSDTGVATCNFKALNECAVLVDIFSHWESVGHYARLVSECVPGVSLHQHSLMSLFAARRKYKKLVISVGNSDHNIFAIRSLMAFPYKEVCEEVILHLHDACLLNLVEKTVALDGQSLLNRVRDDYGDVTGVESLQSEETWRLIERCVGLGVFGVRSVVGLIKPTQIVVNSRYAADMVENEIGRENASIPVKVGFHPVFGGDVRVSPYKRWDRSQVLRVGSFGIPSGGKGTPTVVSACRELSKFGCRVCLVIAGFNAQACLERLSVDSSGIEVEVLSDLTDDELLGKMESVHVAVQLRNRNLGESSGVVSSLIRKGVPTVVTGTGAFNDYQYSCRLVPEGVDATELAGVLLEIVQSCDLEALRRNQDAYIRKHSPSKWCDVIFGDE
jgi:hypothetical protein